MIDLLQNYCSEAAHAHPDTPAVILGSEQLNYGTIEQFSNQLARAIQAAGCQRGDRVAMVLPKTPRSIASILGILKADCSYVPVDPNSPSLRALRILESAEPGLLLVDPSGMSLWKELSGISPIVRDKPMGWL